MTVDYKYNAFGVRIEEDDTPAGSGTTTTKFALNGWNPTELPSPSGRGVGGEGSVGATNFNVFADLNSGGSLTTRYLYGDMVDQILARIDGTTPRWYLTDHLGSVRDVIDNSGVSKDAIAYLCSRQPQKVGKRRFSSENVVLPANQREQGRWLAGVQGAAMSPLVEARCLETPAWRRSAGHLGAHLPRAGLRVGFFFARRGLPCHSTGFGSAGRRAVIFGWVSDAT